MLCVGAIGIWWATSAPTEPEAAPITTRIDLSTAERAAESFLDAWRKRDHSGARSAAVGEAQAAVDAREARDRALSGSERQLNAQLWDELARDRLRLLLNESNVLDAPHGGEALELLGVAQGRFMGDEYQREVRFELERQDEDWHVRVMELGEILSDTPAFLRLEE